MTIATSITDVQTLVLDYNSQPCQIVIGSTENSALSDGVPGYSLVINDNMPNEVTMLVQNNSVSVVTQAEGSMLQLQTEPAQLQLESNSRIDVVSVAEQGPPGPDAANQQVSDYEGDVVYVGEAAPNATFDQPVWCIKRVTIDSLGNVTEAWANNTDAFVNAWSQRLSYSY